MKLRTTLELIFLVAILGELIEIHESFELTRPYKYYRPRPYKYYRPRPRSRKPRWRSFRKPPTYKASNTHWPKHPYYRHVKPPIDTRYHPDLENAVEKNPFTIQIKLPKRHKSTQWSRHRKNQNYDFDGAEDYYSDKEDYPDEEFEDRILQAGRNGIRIKIVRDERPDLQIKISRHDGV